MGPIYVMAQEEDTAERSIRRAPDASGRASGRASCVTAASGLFTSNALPEGARLRFIDVDETFALRKAVLRPDLTPELAREPYLDQPHAFHVGLEVGGVILSIASFMPDAPKYSQSAPEHAPRSVLHVHKKGRDTPHAPQSVLHVHEKGRGAPHAPRSQRPKPAPDVKSTDIQNMDLARIWFLRGMATDAAHRGAGFGSAVLSFGIAELERRNASLVWCNGRLVAQRFYKRMGFKPVGPRFDKPHSGPHRIFIRKLG